MFYSYRGALSGTFIPAFQRKIVTTALVINRRCHLCVYLSLCALLLSVSSMAHLQLSPAGNAEEDRAVIQIFSESRHVEISDTSEGGKSLHGHVCSPPPPPKKSCAGLGCVFPFSPYH